MSEDDLEGGNNAGSEMSLLDMLITVAENWRLLIAGPLLAGLLALGFGFQLPKQFTSEAILALPVTAPTTAPSTSATPPIATGPTYSAQVASLMTLPLILDQVIGDLDLSNGRPQHVVRKELAARIKATVGKDGLLRLEVTDGTPQDAQKIGRATIDAWIKSTIPKGAQRSDLEKRLEYAKNSLVAIDRLLKRLMSESSVELNKSLTRNDAGNSIISIGELQARYFSDVLSIPHLLNGVSSDVVKQPPSLPSEPVAPRKTLITLLAVLLTGSLLVIWVFIRKAWLTALQKPEAAEKYAKFLSILRGGR